MLVYGASFNCKSPRDSSTGLRVCCIPTTFDLDLCVHEERFLFIFHNQTQVRELTEDWIRQYKEERPHDSLGDLTPLEYLAKHEPETPI